ncbi:MAG: hypothetical protein WD941_04975 [Opitutus sp.]
MKKALLITITLLVVLVLAVYLGGHLFLGSITKAGVNKFGPGITQTTVHLDGANISPLSGAGTLTGLTVGNPKGWSENNALSLGRVYIDVAPLSLLGDHIVINEIIIDQAQFLYETKIVASNIGDLLKNIEQSLGAKDEKDPNAAPAEPIKMVVKKLLIQDGRIALGVGGTAIALPMPPIILTDLGTAEGGITPGQLAAAVMRSVTSSIVAATRQAMSAVGGTSGAAAAEGVKQLGGAIKGLFGGGKKKEEGTK